MRPAAFPSAALAALVTLLSVGVGGAAATGAGGSGSIKRDALTILVKFAKPSQARAIAGQEGDADLGETAGKVSIIGLAPGKGVDRALDRYQRRQDVVYAEPNFLATAALATPNDTSYGAQWSLVKVDAIDGWSIYPGSYAAAAGPTIAVVDTGVDLSHPDLSGHLLLGSGANCLSGICDGAASVADDNGHGTHVSGIAAALANNQTGIAGVAFNSPVLPVKALDSTGTGSYASISSAIDWAASHGAKVINLSLGGYAYSSTLCDAVTSAVQAGVLVVAAAGNDNTSQPLYPAACPGAVGVAATDTSDGKASFSNFGSPDVFVSAPGVSIYSTYTNDGYATLSGTSMATPFVSGLAALLFGQTPSRTVPDVKTLLATSSDKISGTYGSDPYGTCDGCTWSPSFGYGRIDVASALGGAVTPPSRLFAPFQATSVGSSPEAVAIGDVTGDGRNDVVMTTSFYFDPVNDYHLFVFAQAPDGSLLPPVSYLTAGAYGHRPATLAIGDITGDGRADVVVGDDGLGVEVFPQLQSGALGSPTMTASANSGKIGLGDFNRDGRLDVAGIGWGTNTVDVFLNDGRGGLAAPVQYAAQQDGYEDLEVGDVTGDGLDDIVVMSGQGLGPNFDVLAQLSAGGFAQQVQYSVGVSGGFGLTHGIGIGDVTGDGNNDVVVSYGGNKGTSFIAVFPQGAAGALGGPVKYDSYDIPTPVEVADVDGDGRADVVAEHSGWNEVGVYRQRADGTLASEDLYSAPYGGWNPNGLAVGDFTGDGTPDVAVADVNRGLVVLRNTGTPAPPAVPGAPGLTSATGGDHSVTLLWKAPSQNGSPIGGYKIYRSTAPGAETLLTSIGPATTFTDTTAANGSTYYYEVSAVNGVGEGPRSSERSATAATVPAAPSLQSAAPTGQSVSLAWAAPSDDGGSAVTRYRIYRGTTRGAETLLASTGGGAIGYTDGNTSYGTTYYYEVSAVNGAGESLRSNELAATPVPPDTTPPSTPSNLRIAATGTSQLIVEWTSSTDNVGVMGYRVYRDGALVTTAAVPVYLDSGLAAGSMHTYVVRAVDAAGNQSQPSVGASGKTSQPKGKTSTLSGVVVSEAGTPLANAVVAVAGSGKQPKTTTGTNGAWSLGNFSAGTYSFTITLAGYRTATTSATVSTGSTLLTLTVLPQG
jgi:subtilisin family serine protease